MKVFIFFIIFYVPCIVWAQKDSSNFLKTKYDVDFEFYDGIYLNFNQFKDNAPVSFNSISIPFDVNSNQFIEQLIESESFTIVDGIGNSREIKTNTIWGFAWKGGLNVNWNNEINRVPVIGSISHFVANKTVYSTQYSPYYNPYMYSPDSHTTVSKELRQYMLDFETGKIIDYTETNLKIILMRDAELYAEYNSLSKRKKKEQMFIYLRRYNERHLIYFPVY